MAYQASFRLEKMNSWNTTGSSWTRDYNKSDFPSLTRVLEHAEIRCIVETVLIFISILANMIGLALVCVSHCKRKSVYHILYISVSVSNVSACLLTWFVGNLILFFRDWFTQTLVIRSDRYCEALVYLNAGLPIALCVAIQMNIMMLSLTVCQYLAICKPLQRKYLLQKRRAILMIIGSILAFFICAGTPFGLSVFRVRHLWKECDSKAQSFIAKNITFAVNIYSAIIILLYVVILALAWKIFRSLKAYSSRTRRMSERKEINACAQKLMSDQRAYTATMSLLLSRTIFTIPLQVYFVYNLNKHGLHDNTTVMYLTILPCVKCIFDPLIYGTLMRGVSKTVRNMSSKRSGSSGTSRGRSSSSKRPSCGSISAARNSVFLSSSPPASGIYFDGDPTSGKGLYRTGTVLNTILEGDDKSFYL